MSKVQENTEFYAQHYAVAAHWLLRPGAKIVLGNKEPRICRFCGRSSPEVTFRMDAHALPESVGNKALLTNYECDACNQAFGEGCENDFGNWTLPMRTLARINGKNGPPSIKQGPGNAWRVDHNATGLAIGVEPTEGFLVDDPIAKTLTFTLRRAPYRPARVAQALYKMALSVMPEEQLPNFRLLLDWMKPDSEPKMAAPSPIIHSFVGGGWERDYVRVAVLTRISDDMPMPYCFFIVAFGNEMFQAAIPSTERDSHLYGRNFQLPTFPFCQDEAAVLSGSIRTLSLFSDEWVRDDSVNITLSYQNSVPRNQT